jgi:hypothetical protein
MLVELAEVLLKVRAEVVERHEMVGNWLYCLSKKTAPGPATLEAKRKFGSGRDDSSYPPSSSTSDHSRGSGRYSGSQPSAKRGRQGGRRFQASNAPQGQGQDSVNQDLKIVNSPKVPIP